MTRLGMPHGKQDALAWRFPADVRISGAAARPKWHFLLDMYTFSGSEPKIWHFSPDMRTLPGVFLDFSAQIG